MVDASTLITFYVPFGWRGGPSFGTISEKDAGHGSVPTAVLHPGSDYLPVVLTFCL